jgi:hypothetical protein
MIKSVIESGPVFQTGTCHNDSFGPIGIITRVSADRLKGFVGAQTSAVDRITPIRDQQQLGMLIGIVRTGISELDRTGMTRLTIRSIVDGNLSEELAASMRESGAKIEASIPLKNGMSQMQMVYIGYNGPSRRASPGELARSMAVISDAKHPAIKKAAAGGLTIEVLDCQALSSQSNAEWASSLVDMLSKGFGYSKESAMEVLSDGRNIVTVVKEGDGIVGMCAAEVREVPLEDGASLRMAEITDCYIRLEYRNKGCCSKMLRTLSDTALKTMDVVFTESNSENPAMANSILRCGHELAGDGVTVTGILEKHAVVESGVRNLFVTYQP